MADDSTTVLPASMAPKGAHRSLLLPLLALVAVAATLTAGYFFQRAGEQEAAIAAARAEAGESQSNAAIARRQVEKLKAEVATLQGQILKFKDAPLPALLDFRAGPPGQGFVAQIENQSADPLPVTVDAQRPSTGDKKSFELTVPARGVAEIGAGDGWSFANGDTLTVSSGQSKPLSLRIP
jgi:hypothetical protein